MLRLTAGPLFGFGKLLGGNKKLLLRRFSTVQIVQEFQYASTQPPPTNIIVEVFCLPPLGVDSTNRPNLTHGRPSEGVGRGLLHLILFHSIK